MMGSSAEAVPSVGGDTASDSSSSAIRLEGVRKAFRGRQVLSGVDLEVPTGSLLGLVGLNGAGKTTTLRIILGLLRADSGRVEVLDRDAPKLATLSPRVGATLHLPGLDPRLTVRANLRHHALLHGRRADPSSILERLQLAYLAGRRVSRISQGERQRVALARALLLEPEVLVLDEPLTHLDPGAVFSVLEVLREEVSERGRTVLLSSHQLELVEQSADRLALLHDGAVLLAGTMGELLSGTGQRYLTLVDSTDLATRVLGTVPEVERVVAVDENRSASVAKIPGYGELAIEARGADPAALNALLHRNGVKVAMFVPEQRSLSRVFREAVEEKARGSSRSEDQE